MQNVAPLLCAIQVLHIIIIIIITVNILKLSTTNLKLGKGHLKKTRTKFTNHQQVNICYGTLLFSLVKQLQVKVSHHVSKQGMLFKPALNFYNLYYI